MEKYVTIKESDLNGILNYAKLFNKEAFDRGLGKKWEACVEPFADMSKLQTPEAFVRNQEFETFCENLQDCYGVNVSAVDKRVLWNLFDKFHEEFTGETSGIECDIITRLINTTPLPAFIEEDEGGESCENHNPPLINKVFEYLDDMLHFSDKETKVFESAFSEDSKRLEVALIILDFATQTIEKAVAKTEGVKPISFGVEHKGYILPEKIDLPEPDYPTTKKGNMAYWDKIEGAAETLVHALLNHLGELEAEDSSLDKDDLEDVLSDALVDVVAEITEFTVDLLIKEFNAVYSYVDESY